MTTVCKVPGCAKYLNARCCFCWWHWEILPEQLKMEINLAFSEHAHKNGKPGVEYLARVQEAVDYILRSEALAEEIDGPS